jgi:hypothetical protein
MRDIINFAKKVQIKMRNSRKSRAFTPSCESPHQLTPDGFEHPFDRELYKSNRWVLLSHLIPWDEIISIYNKAVGISSTGRPGLNPRIVLGSLMIKHLCHLDDRETVEQISENIYMQYFLGYSSFTSDKPFDASLFVDIRKRLGMESINAINEKIVSLKTRMEEKRKPEKSNPAPENIGQSQGESRESESSTLAASEPGNSIENKGTVIFDATACPQDIAYPTDLDLLSEARQITERLIDKLYVPNLHGIKKPRTYRKIARKEYLSPAQKKNKSGKAIRRGIRKQLGFLRRNIRNVHRLLDKYEKIPLKHKELRSFWVIQTLYGQQLEMYETRTHTIEDRIVSIHQPHVRPIVRGKSQAKVEFGAKIHVSLIDGISFLDELSWDAFNEGSHMESYVEQYKKRFGFYPRQVLADQIYCTRVNRRMLKEKGIRLKAKPLGRPPALSIHVSPGERNPIEGKFGQAKTGYGLNRIKARLKETSESWIAGILLALNLVKLAGAASLTLISKRGLSFSAQMRAVWFDFRRFEYFRTAYSYTQSLLIANCC